MELFEKIYGCYYQTVRRILEQAAIHPVTKKQMEAIAKTYGYQESALTIVPKLLDGEWALLTSSDASGPYHSLLRHPIKLPLTRLQKSWMKALLSDQRIRLFFNEEEYLVLKRELADINPLFSPHDFLYFDQYTDGDPYDSSIYREHFHTILESLETGHTLIAAYRGKSGQPFTCEIAPFQLQYSAKNDRFRLLCLTKRSGRFHCVTTWNVSRIEACHMTPNKIPESTGAYRFQPIEKAPEPVVISISGRRNSLERCMLHFANYEKHTEYDEQKQAWICSIFYDQADESELLIELLSFGPVIRVLGPETFLNKVKERVKIQHDLLCRPLT